MLQLNKFVYLHQTFVVFLIQRHSNAEALGAAGSIVGIVAFGLQLATTLQTYVEAATEAGKRLRDIAFDINSPASALKQLQNIIDADQVDSTLRKSSKDFKDEGLKEIEFIAMQCTVQRCTE